MIEGFAASLRRHEVRPRAIRAIGAMADLVPRHQLAEITTLLGAPYVNTFGATETGLPPATASLIPIGAAPTDLAKRQSGFCEVRLVDPDDRDVADGVPGECAIRGPTLFSGYWRAPEVNAKDFRGGWFHMGDMFIRREDGRLDFVDRAKYLIDGSARTSTRPRSSACCWPTLASTTPWWCAGRMRNGARCRSRWSRARTSA